MEGRSHMVKDWDLCLLLYKTDGITWNWLQLICCLGYSAFWVPRQFAFAEIFQPVYIFQQIFFPLLSSRSCYVAIYCCICRWRSFGRVFFTNLKCYAGPRWELLVYVLRVKWLIYSITNLSIVRKSFWEITRVCNCINSFGGVLMWKV